MLITRQHHPAGWMQQLQWLLTIHNGIRQWMQYEIWMAVQKKQTIEEWKRLIASFPKFDLKAVAFSTRNDLKQIIALVDCSIVATEAT